ncbi:MAG: alpha-glucan family phosphorylase, partial [Chloroflexi bacterium]|nr:alpha-glucan family phosphorylase [Chloroflexota bacterium]
RLFEMIDPALWHDLLHNPIRLLRGVSPERMQAMAHSGEFRALYEQVMRQYDDYMTAPSTWYHANVPYAADKTIAYLSAEFGLHESLPIYSGGLGVLAGDTCKEASDLGLPLVAVGFLYPQGFFRQQIAGDGRQVALDEKVNFAEVPAVAVKGADGRELLIAVELPGRAVYARLWRIQVGRVPLFMMDTDIEQNAPQDRRLVAQLYRGDQDVRIAQEMVLGIGGVRALRALGIAPAVWHLNEGHAAFLTLELAREHGSTGSPRPHWPEVVERVRRQTVFTTHTPVAAGNDAFPPELMDTYFRDYYPKLGLSRDEFMNLALHDGRFSMTVLALRLSGWANGVSRAHGEVSRQMWGWLWSPTPADRAPIRAITNGVHTGTWLAPSLHALYDRYLGENWLSRLDDPQTWKAIEAIPDEELWAAHNQQRQALIELARALARERLARLGQHPEPVEGVVEQTSHLLDPNILTIGFARRFATYKRATLMFRDAERLKRLINDPQRPMQVIFAGKAHPADEPAQEFIRQVYQWSQADGFRGRIHFLEEYNMHTARVLTSGVDVWLNNPRRPLEASGTSGMKASLNGIPNASIADGWWAEGYQGANGWEIGNAATPGLNAEQQDAADAESLYTTLEQKIIPLFYERDDKGIPRGWVRVMKEAIRTVAPQFSTRRMVKEYVKLWGEALAKEGAV